MVINEQFNTLQAQHQQHLKSLPAETNKPKERVKQPVPLHYKLQLNYLLTGGEKKLKKEST